MSDAPSTMAMVCASLRDHPKNIFEVPEILGLIASYFNCDRYRRNDKSSIQSCLRVSKAFYFAFAPSLWSDLVLVLHWLVPLENVATNAQFVRSLLVGMPVSEDYRRVLFPHLTSLAISAPEWTQEPYLNMIRKYSEALRTLDLGCGCSSQAHNKVDFGRNGRFLPELPRLRILKLSDAVISDQENTAAFWTLCATQLEFLALFCVTINGITVQSAEPTSPSRLRKIYLHALTCDQGSFEQLIVLSIILLCFKISLCTIFTIWEEKVPK
jgi:hypothetical protein